LFGGYLLGGDLWPSLLAFPVSAFYPGLASGVNLIVVSRSVLSRFLAACVAFALYAAAMYGETHQPVSDEALRLLALRATFAGMEVSVDQGKRIDGSWPEKPKPREIVFPDALADEAVYRVVGKATNNAETWASDDVITPGKFSHTRQVRFRLFRWPGEMADGLLAVLQYDFAGANPAMSCPSIGLLVHLVGNGAGWRLRDEYLLETVHHHSLQRIELLDLTGDGIEELVIESDWGGAGVIGSSLQVFDLSHGRFDEILDTESRLEDSDQEGFMQVLDIGRTLQTHGQRFCFSKTILFEKGKWSKTPRMAHPCYRRGYLVETGASERNKMLVPIR
jgi:hypothetical protein